MFRVAFAVLALFLAGAPLAAAQPTAADFASAAAMRDASISPDGNYIVAIQGIPGGEAIVVIDWRRRQAQQLRTVSHERGMFFESVAWKGNDRVLFQVRQRTMMMNEGLGSRNRSEAGEVDIVRYLAMNRNGANLTQLFENNRLANRALSIMLVDALEGDPDHVLMGTWGSSGFTLYRVDVNDGRTTAVEDAAWETFDMIVNRDGRAIMRIDALPYGSGYRYYRRPASGGRWTVAHEVRRQQTTQNRDFFPISAGPGPSQVYVAARPEGQEYQAIYLYDTSTGELGQPIFSYPNADAAIVRTSRADNSMIYACAETQRFQCTATDRTMQRHLAGLTGYFENRADFSVDSSSTDGRFWLVNAWGPTVPPTFYIYDVAAASMTPIGQTHPNISRSVLSDTQVVNYTSRDGVALWGYLTTPARSQGPFPTVIMPHGGPESRDSYGFDFIVQFLVSRGYAVFQPNFRGSEGSGRSFARAGYRQWGGVMQNDITDGVQHLTTTGVANRDRICIAGISYGGYAALAGASLTPDLYKCAISIAGISDLPEFLDSERADAGRRSDSYAYWREIIGDGDSRDQMIAASPRRHVDSIRVPILLIHGEKDGITLASQSERMRDAMQRAGKNARYVEIEGNVYHPWNGWTTEDVRRLLVEMETFLNQNIGSGATQ